MHRKSTFLVASLLFFVVAFWPKNAVSQPPTLSEKSDFLTVAEQMRDSLPPYSDLSDDQITDLAKRLFSQAQLLEAQLLQEFSYAEYAREQAESAFEKKKKDPSGAASEQKEAEARLEAAKSRERKSKALRDKASKTASFAEKTMKKSSKILREELPKVEASIISLLHQTEAFYDLPQKLVGLPPEEIGIVPTLPTLTEGETKTPGKRAETPPKRRNFDDYEQYDVKKDPAFFPPKPTCEIAFEGKDEFSGEKRTDLKRELLWTFTNDFMRNFLKDKPHILGEANLSATSNGLKFLNLTITIQDNNAKKGFGGLSRGANLTLKFIDGSSVLLRNARSDEGFADELGGFTVFTGLFPIEDRGILAQIKKKELDRIRLAWANGFEDYEIFNVDLLMRQAECLFK